MKRIALAIGAAIICPAMLLFLLAPSHVTGREKVVALSVLSDMAGASILIVHAHKGESK